MSYLWEKLIKNDRIRQSTRAFPKISSAIASDHGRVVFSSPFRRMQQKAQVFSLETNASVRSRLTHSIEVSHIGRYIADLVNEEENLGVPDDLKNSLSMIVEIACLIHDIGNPPFGHLGEAAIQDWFRSSDLEISGSELNDFLFFDGNPQGFRIITKLQGAPGQKGLNLTCTQLASFIKYPCFPDEVDSGDPLKKKPGVFLSEKSEFESIRSVFSGVYKLRHPLVYLMEASDDIAYSLSDIEDGIEKKIITFDRFSAGVLENLDGNEKGYVNQIINEIGEGEDQRSKLISFRTKIINEFVKRAVTSFSENINLIVDGDFPGIFPDNSFERNILDAITKVVRRYIYNSREAEDIEIAGYNVIHSLLNSFRPLLEMSKDEFSALLEGDKKVVKKFPYHSRLLNRLPKAFIENYKYEVRNCDGTEKFFRAHLIVDYICGMTDDFALQIHQLLSGIKVESIR